MHKNKEQGEVVRNVREMPAFNPRHFTQHTQTCNAPLNLHSCSLFVGKWSLVKCLGLTAGNSLSLHPLPLSFSLTFLPLLPNSLLTPGSLAYLISPSGKGKKWLLLRLYYVVVPYPWVKLTLTRRAVLIAVGSCIVTGCFSIEIVVGLPI